MEFGFALLDAGGLEGIDECEQLALPVPSLRGLDEWSDRRWSSYARSELLGLGRDVPRPSLAAIGKDGAFVEFTAAAAAVGFAALPPQGIERAREERFSSEAHFEQLRELLLGLEELRAEGAELLVHGLGPGYSVDHYQYIPTDRKDSFGSGRKKVEKKSLRGELG